MTVTDVFKAVKPSILFHQIDGRKRAIDALKQREKPFFYLTKHVTGITYDEGKKLWEEYLKLKAERNGRKTVQKKILFENNRLFPLPCEHYQKVAEKVYQREGCPKFGKSYFDGVAFGLPTTFFSNYVNKKPYSNQVLIERTIGVVPLYHTDGKYRLKPILDSLGEINLLNRRR